MLSRGKIPHQLPSAIVQRRSATLVRISYHGENMGSRNFYWIVPAFSLLLLAPLIVFGQAPKKASEQFKNIQVLKDVPADQLIPTMQFMAASLGVGCDLCHVP